MKNQCGECESREGIKCGWSNVWYCSEQCELTAVSNLHRSMPNSGPLPYYNWVPHHIKLEISKRWEEESEE
jgi:hypothetical protein